MTDYRLAVTTSGEVRDANGNLKSEEIVTLSGDFTDEELAQIMHQLNIKMETQ